MRWREVAVPEDGEKRLAAIDGMGGAYGTTCAAHQRRLPRVQGIRLAVPRRRLLLMRRMVSGMSARAWTLFAIVAVLWGIPYLFIKVAVDDMSPAMVAFGRIVVAFAVLLPYAWYKGAFRGLLARWRIMVFYSVVEITLPWPLIGFGETRVSSGLAAILIAAVPLVVALLAIRFDHAERAHGSRLVGLVVGFAGVVVLLGLDVAGRPGELLGAGAILLAAVGYAAGPMIIKQRLSDLDPLGPVTASMGISMVLLAPFALGTWPDESPGGDAIALGGRARRRSAARSPSSPSSP